MQLLTAISTLLFCFLATSSLASCLKQKQLKSNASGYVEVKQGKLYYQKFGSGAPIVILHGGPGLDQTFLQPQMLALAKNHTVIFYDQRGSGKSLQTKLNTTYININQFTQDLEELRKQLRLDSITILGHSWGGLLGMHYAIHYPNHVSALILLSTAPADFKGEQAFISEFDKKTQPIKKAIAPLTNYQEFEKLSVAQITKLYRTVSTVYFYNPKDVAKLTLNLDESSAKNGVKVMQIMSASLWSTTHTTLFPQLKKLTIPTLIIHGAQDVVPLWTAQEIKNAIPQAQIKVLEKCGHFPYIEKPIQLFSQINLFLRNISLHPQTKKIEGLLNESEVDN